ncbi:hypothetical protein [Streptomyces sp. NPDC056264]|uniref:hypothetical protein n=1 Tax=Streptomyces sp. NPDC056264 TaxID=3345767 RepID=UPI003AABAA7A
MPLLDIDPGQSPEAAGTLYFYEQGANPSTGFQVTSRGAISAPGGVVGPVSGEVSIVSATAATDAIQTRVTGDAQPRLTVDADGTLRWGDGAGAPDISINRYAAGGLEVSGALRFTNGQLLFRSDGSVNVYSSAANTLTTDDAFQVGGDVTLAVAGSGIRIKEGGAAARMGVATLVAGTVVVNTTAVTANSRIFLTCNTSGGTPGFLRVSARSAGASFTILSSSGTDTSVVAWEIKEPAP